MRLINAFFLTLLAVIPMHLTAQQASEFIFQPGSTTFASSHASTLVELEDGSILSAWFGGTAEGRPDVAIWSSRRTNSVWSKPAELAREPNIACWNPVLFYTRDSRATDARLWLYYKFGPDPQSWTAARRYSDDDGITWSKAEHLPAGLIGPVRAKPQVLADGIIVSGSSIHSPRIRPQLRAKRMSAAPAAMMACSTSANRYDQAGSLAPI